MTDETLSVELFERFPEMHRQARASCWYSKEEPLNYVIFGNILKPYLERALREGDLKAILAVCAFLEDAATSHDAGIANLLGVEIGEWLAYTPYEGRIGPWLGSETKRIFGYVPGLATQRHQIRNEKWRRSLRNRIATFWGRLFASKPKRD